MSLLIALFRLCAAASFELLRATFPQPRRMPVKIAVTRKAPGK